MIINRLKEVLCDIIAPNQASFMPGRQGIDNVVICQEVIHIPRYTKSKRGRMVLKLELEKAYDMMEWKFVEETLRDVLCRQRWLMLSLVYSRHHLSLPLERGSYRFSQAN